MTIMVNVSLYRYKYGLVILHYSHKGFPVKYTIKLLRLQENIPNYVPVFLLSMSFLVKTKASLHDLLNACAWV